MRLEVALRLLVAATNRRIERLGRSKKLKHRKERMKLERARDKVVELVDLIEGVEREEDPAKAATRDPLPTYLTELDTESPR